MLISLGIFGACQMRRKDAMNLNSVFEPGGLDGLAAGSIRFTRLGDGRILSNPSLTGPGPARVIFGRSAIDGVENRFTTIGTIVDPASGRPVAGCEVYVADLVPAGTPPADVAGAATFTMGRTVMIPVDDHGRFSVNVRINAEARLIVIAPGYAANLYSIGTLAR